MIYQPFLLYNLRRELGAPISYKVLWPLNNLLFLAFSTIPFLQYLPINCCQTLSVCRTFCGIVVTLLFSAFLRFYAFKWYQLMSKNFLSSLCISWCIYHLLFCPLMRFGFIFLTNCFQIWDVLTFPTWECKQDTCATLTGNAAHRRLISYGYQIIPCTARN